MAVIGAGAMGTGIAIVFAAAGCPDVRLMSRHKATLQQAANRIAGAALPPDSRHGAIGLTTSLAEAAGGSELIIESISEDLDAKVSLLRSVEACVSGSAILASNTSSVPIDDLGYRGWRGPAGSPRSYHCFNPPEMIELVEVVSGRDTAAGTIAQLCRWAVSAGRAPIHVRRAVPGFIANRLQYALLREAVRAGRGRRVRLRRRGRGGPDVYWRPLGRHRAVRDDGSGGPGCARCRGQPALSGPRDQHDRATRPGEMVSDGALGCKTGRGLRGNYSAEDVARIEAGRDRMLLAMRALRERERT